MLRPTAMFTCDECGDMKPARQVQGLMGPVFRGLPTGWATWWSNTTKQKIVCSTECHIKSIEKATT